MTNSSLGRLERVDLRSVWASEPADFTPWLAQPENLRVLGDTIGLELEIEGIEQPVGSFSADILCKDTASGRYVVIENQLERTDHSHLGQILTYGAGFDATTVVWVARRFADEHRASLTWLNELVGERLNIFGLEVELWRIGDSAVAPKFNIVAQPNDWIATAHRVQQERGLTVTKQTQQEFWTGFKEFLEERGGVPKATKPLAQSWMNIAIGRTGFQLAACVSSWDSESGRAGSEIRAELSVFDGDTRSRFDALLEEKGAVETEFGTPLTWYTKDEVRAKRVYIRDLRDWTDRNTWPECFGWLAQNLEGLDKVFRHRIRDLT